MFGKFLNWHLVLTSKNTDTNVLEHSFTCQKFPPLAYFLDNKNWPTSIYIETTVEFNFFFTKNDENYFKNDYLKLKT